MSEAECVCVCEREREEGRDRGDGKRIVKTQHELKDKITGRIDTCLRGK